MDVPVVVLALAEEVAVMLFQRRINLVKSGLGRFYALRDQRAKVARKATRWLAGSFLVFAAQSIQAADVMSIGAIDPRSTGKVSSGQTIGAGRVITGISVDGAEKAVNAASINSEGGSDRLIDRVNRATVFFGLGLGNRIELDAGVHGSYESVSETDREKTFAGNTAATNIKDNLKHTAYSGISILAKVKLFEQNAFTATVAPFFESGAGQRAGESLTRNVNPRAGYLGILTYGERGIGELSVNGGMRYRNPELIGDVTVRNEIIYGVSLKGYLTRNFALFTAGQGRRIKAAGSMNEENGKPDYRGKDSGELTGGLMFHAGKTDISAWAGGATKRDAEFGNGRFIAGLSLTVAMGGSTKKPVTSIASEVDQKVIAEHNNQAPKESWEPKTAPAPVAVESVRYPEMETRDINPIRDLEASGVRIESSPDDFDLLKARMQRDSQTVKAKGISQEERVEAELAALRDAEKKTEAEQNARRLEEERIARERAAKAQIDNDRRLENYRTQARKDAAKLQGVSADDVNWNGLE